MEENNSKNLSANYCCIECNKIISGNDVYFVNTTKRVRHGKVHRDEPITVPMCYECNIARLEKIKKEDHKKKVNYYNQYRKNITTNYVVLGITLFFTLLFSISCFASKYVIGGVVVLICGILLSILAAYTCLNDSFTREKWDEDGIVTILLVPLYSIISIFVYPFALKKNYKILKELKEELDKAE